MKEYKKAIQYILENGTDKCDRTGVGTRSIFGYQMRFDLQKGFPAITTKKLAWKACVSELLWFLEGSGDERRLAEILHGSRDPSNQTIWTANAGADYWISKARYPGDAGRIYGVQWRHWQAPTPKWHPKLEATVASIKEVDQLQNLIDGIKKDPSSRRHLLTAYNPGELDQMSLPPCHCFSQFDVTNGKLSCQLYQRSADMGLGVPFNLASYALLTHMIAQLCNLKVGDLIWTGGDCHVYLNHIDQLNEQLKREAFPLPTLEMPQFTTLGELLSTKVNDYKLINYQHHAAIKMPMAV